MLISIPGGASGSYWMRVGVSLHPFLRCMNLSGKGTLQLICTTPRSAFSQYFVERRSDISRQHQSIIKPSFFQHLAFVKTVLKHGAQQCVYESGRAPERGAANPFRPDSGQS